MIPAVVPVVVIPKFARGEVVYRRGTKTPIKIRRVMVAAPGYLCSDGRFFCEDEISRRPGPDNRKFAKLARKLVEG